MGKKITRKDRNTMFLLASTIDDLNTVVGRLEDLNTSLDSSILTDIIEDTACKCDNYMELFDKYIETQGKGKFYMEVVND